MYLTSAVVHSRTTGLDADLLGRRLLRRARVLLVRGDAPRRCAARASLSSPRPRPHAVSATWTVGPTLTIVQHGSHADYQDGAVLRDIPDNSHRRPAMFARLTATAFPENPNALTSWNNIQGA